MNDASAVPEEPDQAHRLVANSFDRVFAAHHARLLQLATLVGGDRTTAEDAVADVFARLLRSGDRLRDGIDDPVAYLNRAVVNQVRGAARRAHRRDRFVTPRARPADDFERGVEDRDRVLRALAGLNHRQRAVVVLRFYEDLAEATIAEQLGIPLGTVKSSLSRALPILRRRLKDDR